MSTSTIPAGAWGQPGEEFGRRITRSDRPADKFLDIKRLPPADAIDHGAIREALVAYHGARSDARAARAVYDDLRRQSRRDEAIRADARATADAISAGKRDPGPKHLADHDRAVMDAQRHRDAADMIVSDRHEQLEDAVVTHGREWRETNTAKLTEAYARWLSLVDELEAVAATIDTAAAVNQFFYGRMFKPGRAAARLHSTDGRGEMVDVPVSEAAALLRTLDDPTVPRDASMRSSTRMWFGNG